MNKLKLILAACSLAVLTACATKPVTVYKEVAILPPDNLLVNCNVEKPPGYERYFIASWTEKEKILFDFGGKQTANLITCNDRWGSLRDWKQRQLNLHKP